jgi:MoxR-like ATPase
MNTISQGIEAGPQAARGEPSLSLAEFAGAGGRIVDTVATVIDGKREVITTALTVLLAEGHLLIEDVPGVGKTMLARALARSVDCTVNRIQFTPDLLPSDITGVSVYNRVTREFEFKPGPVFANLVIGDEINRASPKTQSALLESMEESQVSVDGVTHRLGSPFAVIATQNPAEMEGTYPLPEAQRDRFMARISMGYPDPESEVAMLRSRESSSPLAEVVPVVTVDGLKAMIRAVQEVFVSRAVTQYAVAIVHATRTDPDLRLGASPRATLHLIRAAKATAALAGRKFVIPDDINALAVIILGHRLILAHRAGRDSSRTSAEAVAEVVRRIVSATLVPVGPVGPA